MKKIMVSLVALWMLIPVIMQAQTNTDTTDQGLINSVATYPKDVRLAILEAAQYPQVLINLERIQGRSSQSFQDLISGFPRNEQENFYEISRYPDRINMMVRDGRKSDPQMHRYIEDLPKSTQTRFLDVYHKHFDILTKMNMLYQSSQESMQKVLSEYPPSVQGAFNKVVSQPDVMNLLTENIDMTMALGQDYKTNPGEVQAQLDQLNAQITTENEQNLATYKSQVESNPEMQNEMKQAADNFSSSYVQDDYSSGADPNAMNPTVVNNYYNYNPYPYWFSYPYWYSTAVWYPRPYYYYTGFYYGPGGRMIVYGWPNRVYSSWFFHAGYYRSYPHLYNNYSAYYHRYPRSSYFAGRYYNSGGHYYQRSRSTSYDGNHGSSNHQGRSTGYQNHTSNLNNNFAPSRNNHSNNTTYSSRTQQLNSTPNRPSNWQRSGSVGTLSRSNGNVSRGSSSSFGSRSNFSRGSSGYISGGHISTGHSTGGHAGGLSGGGRSGGGHSGGGHSGGGHSGGGHSGRGH